MKTIDATKKFTVNVTADNIKKGKVSDSRNCGIELAIEDAIPGAMATVNTSTVQILKPNGTVIRYRNSWAGRKFVQDFDAGRKMLPGIIELLPIPQSLPTQKLNLQNEHEAVEQQAPILAAKVVTENSAFAPNYTTKSGRKQGDKQLFLSNSAY